MGPEVSNTFSFNALSNKAASVTHLLQEGEHFSGQRSSRPSSKAGCESGKLSIPESIFEFNISGSQEGRGEQTSDKSEGVKPSHSLQSFQDGKFVTFKEVAKKGDFMCKVDLKDAYFAVPLHQNSQKFVRFQRREKLYQFLVLCFGLSPAPRIFSKLLKIPIALLLDG